MGKYLDFFWRSVFCATAATIVSGAIAERLKFFAYLWYSLIISLVNTIMAAAKIGETGDGKIFVTPVSRVSSGPERRTKPPFKSKSMALLGEQSTA